MNARTSWKLLALLGVLFSAKAVSAEVMTLYSDQGALPTPAFNIYAFAGGANFQDGSSTDLAPPEGFKSFKSTENVNSYVGWSYQYNVPQDLSRFNTGGASGVLKFWVYSNTGDIQIEIKNSVGLPFGTDVYVKKLSDLGWNPVTMTNQWVEFTIPLAGIDLSSTLCPWVISAQSGPASFYIDNVRYVSSAAAPFFHVSFLNVSDNSPAAGPFTWGASALGSWARSDQYLSVELDSDLASWGLQIYTDNTAGDAHPQFHTSVLAGQIGSNPMGLVQMANPSVTLQLAWSVDSDTTPPKAVEPNTTSDPNAYQWLYAADRLTPAIPAQNTVAFVDGALSNTVKNNQGIHYGQSPLQIGAANPPVRIYLEANFATATAPNTYQTTALRLEYYTQ